MFRRDFIFSSAALVPDLVSIGTRSNGVSIDTATEPDELPITAQELAEREYAALVRDFPEDWNSVSCCGSIKLDRWFSAIYCLGAGKLLDLWAVRVERAMNAYKLRVFGLGKAGPEPLEAYHEGYAPSTVLIVGRDSWEQRSVQNLFADLHAKYQRSTQPRA